MKAIYRCAIAASLILMALSLGASAQASDKHPAYLHALSDLRYARAYLANPDSGELRDPEKNAMAEIDAAIAGIKAAGIDDGKGVDDHPGIDSHLRWIGRLNKAADLLNKAHDEVQKEQDDAGTQGLQSGVIGHIGLAHKHVEEAISLEQ